MISLSLGLVSVTLVDTLMPFHKIFGIYFNSQLLTKPMEPYKNKLFSLSKLILLL